MIGQRNAVCKHLLPRCKAHAHGTCRRRQHAFTQHGLQDKNSRDTVARIRRRTRQEALHETEHNRGRRSEATRRCHRCHACPEQRAVKKGQEDAACSVSKTRPRKSHQKERHKNEKKGHRSRSRKKGEISGKNPPRGARFLVPTDHNFDNFCLRRARGGGLFEPPKRPPGRRLRQSTSDRRAAEKGTRQCVFCGGGGVKK